MPVYPQSYLHWIRRHPGVRFFPVQACPPLAPRHARRVKNGLAGREEAVF
jgi:hypothetical protein